MYQVISNDGTCEVYVYSLMSRGDSAQGVIAALRENSTSRVVVHINSDGGDVFEAIALYNVLRDYRPEVVVEGMCASAASIIACSGHVTMKPGAMMMIHGAMCDFTGNADDHEAMAAMLRKVEAGIREIYMAKTGLDEAEVTRLMEAGTYLTASEAVRLHFADAIDTAGASYEQGVLDERRRIRELDELSGTGREVLLNEAKYISPRNARDVAIELLKSESRPSVSNHAAIRPSEDSIITAIINDRRNRI